MQAAVNSDIGRVRKRNEDTVLADTGRGIFLLADGMGGHRGGDVASRLAVDTAYSLLAERLVAAAPDEIPRLLAEALAAAHAAVVTRALADPLLTEMGTTLDMAVVGGQTLNCCHLGDSRIYLYRAGMLTQLTEDDNYAAWLVTHEHVPPHLVPPDARHMLTRAVGISPDPIPQLRTVSLSGDELLLLCSDGLHGMIDDGEIVELMHHHCSDPDRLAAALVAAAVRAGGHDNVSVVVVDPAETSPLLLL
jgi:protein phosphatase